MTIATVVTSASELKAARRGQVTCTTGMQFNPFSALRTSRDVPGKELTVYLFDVTRQFASDTDFLCILMYSDCRPVN